MANITRNVDVRSLTNAFVSNAFNNEMSTLATMNRAFEPAPTPYAGTLAVPPRCHC